jgi:hypothetical protein
VIDMTHRTEVHTDHYLDQLAHLIARNGINLYESDISRLVVRLHSVGHAGPMVDLLADQTATPIARERAFGILVGQLARGPANTDPHLVDSAA